MRSFIALIALLAVTACSQAHRAAHQDEMVKLAAPKLTYPPPS